MWLDFHIFVVSTVPEYETSHTLTPSDLILSYIILCLYFYIILLMN